MPVADDAPGMNRRTVTGVHGFATATAYLWCWHFHLLPSRILDSIGTSSRDVNPLFLGVSIGIFGRFAAAFAPEFIAPFRRLEDH